MRVLAMAAIGLTLSAPGFSEPASGVEQINGTWIVDLSTEPGTPYTKPMILTLKADGAVEGSF